MNQRDGVSINKDSIYDEYIDGSSKDKVQEVQSMKIKPRIDWNGEREFIYITLT